MKKLLFIFACLLSQISSNAQRVQSSCTAPDSVVAKFRDDADEIALERTYNFNSTYKDSIVINSKSSDTVLRALLAIYNAHSLPERDTVMDIFQIHHLSDYDLKSVGIHVSSNVPWVYNLTHNILPTGDVIVDSLMNKYNLRWDSTYHVPNDLILLSDSNRNAPALGKLFQSASGVTYGGVGYINWSSQTIYFKTTPDYIGVGFYITGGGGWYFRVYDDCSVQFVGYSDVPTAINDVAVADFKIAPNPTTDYLNITSKEPIKAYQIFATDGRLVAEGKPEHNSINVQSLQPSVYTLRLTTDKGSSNLRFVKQ